LRHFSCIFTFCTPARPSSKKAIVLGFEVTPASTSSWARPRRNAAGDLAKKQADWKLGSPSEFEEKQTALL
jgi:hypothetical protein